MSEGSAFDTDPFSISGALARDKQRRKSGAINSETERQNLWQRQTTALTSN